MTKEVTLPAADGYPLAASLYEPGRPAAAETTGPHRVAVVLSSVGGDRRRYAPLAWHLAGRDWTVITFDYRGIGGSRRRSARGFPATMSEWGELDVAGVLDWVDRRLAPERLVVVAHSVGGQVIPLAPNHGLVDALLLVASQAGHWRLRRGIWRYLVLGYFTLTPAIVSLFGCLPLWPSGPERLPAGVALEWRRWCLETEYRNLAGAPLAPRFARLRAPVLAYSFADDPLYSPAAAVEALLALYTNAPSEHRAVRPRDLGVARVGHRGFFDPEVGGRLWPEAVDFLERAG